MKKIESFKTFSQIQNQIREEARQKEIASKREASVAAFNELLSKYNASSIEDLNEEDREEFMSVLTKEGNAFGAARAEAIAKGEDTFKVGDKEMPVKNVDKEDEENAEKFANEAKIKMNNLDWGKTTAERNANLDKYDSLKTDKEKEEFLKSLKNESVVTEGKHDEMLDKVADAVKNASNFMNVGIALKDAGIKYDFSTGMMPMYRLKKYPIAIVNKKYVDKGDREVGDIAIGLLESLTESLITEALEGKSQKEAMKGYAAIQKFMMAHPAFNSKTITDPTVAWFMRTALKEALINVNYHNEAAKVGRAINFAGFSEPVIFAKEMGGMPLPIKRGMMQDKAYDLALAMSKGAKYNGYAIIEAVAMFFDDRFPKTSVAANLRAMLDGFMGEATEIANLEQRINEGSAFNSARLKAIDAGEDEFEFDGKKYPVTNVDKEDEELAKELTEAGPAAKLQAAIDKLKGALEKIEAGKDKIKSEKVKAEKEINQISSQIDNVESDLADAEEDEQDEYREMLTDLEDQLEDAEDRRRQLIEKLEDVIEKQKEIEAKLKDIRSKKAQVAEGSAFNTARLKAIEAGEDEFEFDGKTYPVTNVDKEDKELAKEITEALELVERLDNSTMKRMSGLTDQKELKNFKQAFVNLAQAFYEEGFEYDEVLEYIGALLRDPNIRGSIEEGNAFLGARAKAIEEDAEEFEFNGRTYPVVVKESNETEVLFEAFVEIDSMDPDSPELEKLLKKNKVDMEVMSFGGPSYATPIVRLEGKEKDVIKVLMDKKAGWALPKGEAEYLVEESVHTDVNESYAERKLKDFMEFVKKAENKMVRLSITENGQTNVIEDKLKKGSYGLHKIDYMGFDFEDEVQGVRDGDAFIMGVRPGMFLKWKIGQGRFGTEYLIEVL